MSADEALPEGWARIAAEGHTRPMYFHATTGRVTWDPFGAAEKRWLPTPAPLPKAAPPPTTDASARASQTAAHYDRITAAHTGAGRDASPLAAIVRFNSWVKACLIQTALACYSGSNTLLHVVDLACGKGGDALKWRHGAKNAAVNIGTITAADVSDASVAQATSAFGRELPEAAASVHTLDLSTCALRLRQKAQVVSMQYALHYFGASREALTLVLATAARALRDGGFFVGTIADSRRVSRCAFRKRPPGVKGDLYSIGVSKAAAKRRKHGPWWGVPYTFDLPGAVEKLDEFLAPKKEVVACARELGLLLVAWEDQHAFGRRHAAHSGHDMVRLAMRAPDLDSSTRSGFGLMPSDEAVTGLYSTFIFVKARDPDDDFVLSRARAWYEGEFPAPAPVDESGGE